MVSYSVSSCSSGDSPLTARNILRELGNTTPPRQKMDLAVDYLVERNFVVRSQGNLSLRNVIGEGYLITPADVPWHRFDSKSVVLMHPDGCFSGQRTQSSEWRMHDFIYRDHPDIGAIVHAHPANAVALSHRTFRHTDPLGIPLMNFPYEDFVHFGGGIPILPPLPSGTEELAEHVSRALGVGGSIKYPALILAQHGVVAVGRDLEQALTTMDLVEHLCEIRLKIPPADTY